MIGAIENQELAASNVLCPNQVGVRDRYRDGERESI